MKYWEIIADNLKNAGWYCGCISSTDHEGRAEHEDAGRFIVHAHDIPTAFLELQAAIDRQLERGSSTGKSSLTISINRVGAWAGSQLSTLKDEQSGLWTRIGDRKRFVVLADES